MEAHQQHVPIVVIFQMVTGGRRWYVVVFYIALNNASTLDRVVAEIGNLPHGLELLVAGDSNADLLAPYRHKRDEAILVEMVM